MKKVLCIALSVVCVFLLSGCITFEIVDGNETVDNVVEGSAGGTENLADKVSVKWETTSDRDVCVFLSNESAKIIPHVSGQVLYKDSEGKTVDITEFSFDAVLSGTTVVHCAYAYDVTDTWETYEVTYSLDMDWDVGDKNHADKCTVSSNVGDGNIIVEIKNNAGVKLDEVDYVVVFYKNDEVVYAAYPENRYEISIESGATNTSKADTRGREYDRYEVYLNEAIEW